MLIDIDLILKYTSNLEFGARLNITLSIFLGTDLISEKSIPVCGVNGMLAGIIRMSIVYLASKKHR